MRAPGHHGIALFFGHGREAFNGRAQIRFNQRKPITDLQHQGAIHDVLCGRPPMGPAPGIFAGKAIELRDQPHNRVARIARGSGQRSTVQALGPRDAGDGGGGVFRDDAKPRLGAGKRRFHIQHLLQIGVFAKGDAHGIRAIKRAEHRAIGWVHGHDILPFARP